jgi:plasmid maintenance system antidote protein VapI
MAWAFRLRRAIKDSGLSLYAVARDAHLGYAAVHGFYHGTRGLTLDSAERIARLLGYDMLPVQSARRRPVRRGRK